MPAGQMIQQHMFSQWPRMPIKPQSGGDGGVRGPWAASTTQGLTCPAAACDHRCRLPGQGSWFLARNYGSLCTDIFSRRISDRRPLWLVNALILAGLEPAIFGSEDQRLIH